MVNEAGAESFCRLPVRARERGKTGAARKPTPVYSGIKTEKC
jgi:hypothetical protein